MTWLSKLTLNTRSRSVRRDLANLYDLHRSILRAFPDQRVGGAGRVRFRVEPIEENEAPLIVLVQSAEKPEWSKLAEDYLDGTALVKELPRFELPLGSRWRFRLRANPTKRARAASVGPDGMIIDARWVGKRIGLRREEEQVAWLARKGEQAGFRPIAVTTILESNDRSWRKHSPVTQTAVRFEGMLEVTDPSAFAAALEEGIGSAKGFGFGLLTIARSD